MGAQPFIKVIDGIDRDSGNLFPAKRSNIYVLITKCDKIERAHMFDIERERRSYNT